MHFCQLYEHISSGGEVPSQFKAVQGRQKRTAPVKNMIKSVIQDPLDRQLFGNRRVFKGRNTISKRDLIESFPDLEQYHNIENLHLDEYSRIEALADAISHIDPDWLLFEGTLAP